MELDILIKNASELLTCKADSPKVREKLRDPGIIENGILGIKNDKIVFVGKTEGVNFSADKVIDATNKVVMPGFIDCHTHSVFAGSREKEFVKKLRGVPYLEILKQGGGILDTVEKTRKATKEELLEELLKRLDRMISLGTTTIEIKSGYGLNLETEKKILEVADLADKKHPISIVKTYLGAHTLPKRETKEDYVEEVISSLDKIKPYAEFCDIFCEKEPNFSIEETRKILTAAKDIGYKLKMHSEQLSQLRSAELAAELKAISADHLEYISDTGIHEMAKAGVIGVVLPGVTFHLMTKRYAPAREMINNGLALALATDYNPGTCPSENMQLMISIACREMKMLPAEAINCSTINAAYAISREKEIGSLEVGKKADILILNAKNHDYIPYHFGINHVEKVIKNGKII
ncbi:MAG: imidazolonepropionase [Nitrospinota bacterium]